MRYRRWCSDRWPIPVVAILLVLSLVAPTVAEEKSKADTLQLPRLVDLGAHKCIPCKKMAPILEELKEEYAGMVDVVFLDVWKDPKAGKPYRIRVIPTQIFFDRDGKEVFRHEGFMPKEEIERVFREKMGVATPAHRAPKDEDKDRGRDGDKERQTGLVPWQSVPDSLRESVGGDGVLVGLVPEGPPVAIEIVFTSVACPCVKERCERLGQALRGLLEPYGVDVVQTWTDRAEEPEKADTLLAVWGMEDLPAVALVDGWGRPYYGDDEELDLALLKAWIERRI